MGKWIWKRTRYSKEVEQMNSWFGLFLRKIYYFNSFFWQFLGHFRVDNRYVGWTSVWHQLWESNCSISCVSLSFLANFWWIFAIFWVVIPILAHFLPFCPFFRYIFLNSMWIFTRGSNWWILLVILMIFWPFLDNFSSFFGCSFVFLAI